MDNNGHMNRPPSSREKAPTDTILTLEEVASTLKVSDKTVRRLIKGNSLPAFRVGSSWRIQRRDLSSWIDTGGSSPSPSQIARVLPFPSDTQIATPVTSLPVISKSSPFPPTFVDLFAGCGGLSLGLGNAGWKGILAVEHDAMAFETLKYNLLDKKNYFPKWPASVPKKPLDVLDLLGPAHKKLLKSLKEETTLLAGGPPCQGFSVAGARNGMDERNDLAKAFLEFVECVNPPFVLVENVEGMDRAFKSKPRESKHSVAQEIMTRLRDDLGYEPYSAILQTSEFGVPQARSRLFIFGVRKDLAVGIDPDELNLFAQMQRIREAFLTDKSLPTDRPVTVLEGMGDLSSVECVECPDAAKFQSGRYLKAKSQYSRLMRIGMSSKSIPDSHRYPNHSPYIRERYELFQRELEWGRISRNTLKANGTGKHRVVYIDPTRPAPTLTTSPDDFLHFEQPRIITVREMARLQSFPDWFEFKGRYTINGPRRRFDRARVSQTGNAVPPFVGEVIGHALSLILKAIETAQDDSKNLLQRVHAASR
jgi:DNA (cytosine-5)-methyltransferase 1